MVITWTTLHHVDDHLHVLYSENKDTGFVSSSGVTTTEFHKFYTHRSLLKDLKPSTTYCELT